MKFSKAVTFDYFHGFASLIIGFCMCTYTQSVSVCVCDGCQRMSGSSLS